MPRRPRRLGASVPNCAEVPESVRARSSYSATNFATTAARRVTSSGAKE
ncbi:Uncharacterised protein [Actinomyces howellii]|uniref:Uncharacterized protein n=1 Tax=Actinomyces howellii TaxID=52771 RepID=A0A3S4UXP4_9ACTO|nr:Uncharacterised protein [Actinomyces howellii]